MASHVGTTVPLYSASVLESAAFDCFLLLKEIAPLPREKTNPKVDLVNRRTLKGILVLFRSRENNMNLLMRILREKWLKIS